MAVQDLARIEERIDKTIASTTEVSVSVGGVKFSSMVEVMEFAKLMSVAGEGVPLHLRGNPGMCLAVCIQALEWRMSPFAVANKSYVVNNRIGYESQLVHAVIEQRAPLKGRLRHWYQGEGDERVCVVEGHIRGEAEPIRYQSPPFGKIQPKNSPLWKTKPDLQLYHNTIRDFGRVYFPDVILGVFAEEELRDSGIGPERARDVTPKPDVASRLKGKKGRGFDADHVEREMSQTEATAETSGQASTVATAEASAGADAGPAQPAAPPAQPSDPVLEQSQILNPDTMSHAGRSSRVHGPNSEFDSRDGSQPEIAATTPQAPGGGVEARADAASLQAGPPSIFRQYWEAINVDEALGPRDVARVSNRFFDKHPQEDADRQKFMRLRTVRDNVLAGVYSRQDGEDKAREIIAS